MKKFIVSVSMAALLAAPIFAFADHTTAHMIEQIIKQIQVLQTQLAQLRVQQGDTAAPWCHTFNTNLSIGGSSGADMEALLIALSKEVSYDIKNGFTEDVAAAVVQFQAKYGIRQTGYVGPITRAKLNALYGCPPNFPPTPPPLPQPPSPQPSITVLSPQGGISLTKGDAKTVGWNYDSSLVQFNVELWEANTIGDINGITSGNAWGIDGLILPTPLGQKNFSWTVGSVNCGGPCTPPGLGVYKIAVRGSKADMKYEAGAIAFSQPFSIVADTTVSTPVTLSSISPSSGPVGTSVRLDGCGSDSSSGFTLYFNGPQSGTIAIPVETLGAASGCGYMTLTVPTYFPAGAYTLSVRNNQTGAMSTNSKSFTVTAPTTGGVSGSSAACTTSFSPNAVKIGDYTTWNFAAGTGDTTFQYSCSSRFTKEDGTTPLSYGQLPLSGPWRIKVPGPLDCTLDSYNPNVIGSGSQCRASVAVTFFTITTASLPNAAVNTSYNVTLATTDAGTAPYQWSWSPAAYGSGTMPNGLTLNQSTGVISGTPTTAGKYDVVIKVIDAAGNAPTKTLALYVDAQAGAPTQCTTSFSPSSANIGDVIIWNFQSGAGDTTFQYSCNHGFTKEDGTTPLSYGSLPSSGSWRIKVPGYGFDCTLSSYNPNVIGSGSTCRATLR